MSCEYDLGHGTLTCRFAGHIDSSNCSQISKELVAKLAGQQEPIRDVVFDMEQSDYVSSVFIRLVMTTLKKVGGEHFKVSHANPFIKDLFATSGLDQLIGNDSSIQCMMREIRVFPPPKEFARQALIGSKVDYETLYKESAEHPDAFWGRQAREHLVWSAPFHQVCEGTAPNMKWFTGGQLNASINCLDRHLDTRRADKAALIWEGEPGEERTLTYRQLHGEVCRFANVLKRNGIVKGDRVLIYMPMVPETVVAMQACARLGAIHSVVFGGFSAQAIADRIHDCQAKLVLTADGGFRRGAVVPLKPRVDEALQMKDAEGHPLTASVQKVVVLRRAQNPIDMQQGRDVFWGDEIQTAGADCPAEPVDSEHPLFILYTSGSTGKPKGIFHSTGGYLLGAKLTHQYIFDLKDTDIFWCTADVGWITGHSYLAYGPLANGATCLMYEGAPNHPDPSRFWRLIEKYHVTIFYTAPTAIRAFMQWGDEWPARHNLSSLRLLGTVGEPINPQAWIWYHEVIGGKRCPIVDTWWQTETGAIMIAPMPGAISAKPGSATRPFFGVLPEVVDAQGQPAPANAGGSLVIRRPWPSMLRGIWGDPARYEMTYWCDYPGSYFTGDGARCDEDGYFWVIGRIDDVLNVSGHRIGTAEVESALVSHKSVVEAAVVGRPDDMKGSVIVAFVVLKSNMQPSPELREELRRHVATELGVVARPEEIRFAGALPKTRSGKIMRRLL
ncbi:MAG: acetate--CoA ligase, partial [Lentisphaerota bacterium]